MKTTKIAIWVFLTIGFFIGCSDDDADNDGLALTDQSIFQKLKETGYTTVGHSGDTLPAMGPHSGYILVKFNKIASASLNDSMILPINKALPQGSMVVKEIYNKKGGVLSLYAIMLKDSTHVNSKNGWIWAEYNPDGSAAYSISNKGAGCVFCHAESPSRDNLKLFDAH